MTNELFDPQSPVGHRALEQLRDVLDHLGFSVPKRAPQEATLRVYPKKFRQYPLLNPRFALQPVAGDTTAHGSWLVFTVLSKGDDAIDRHLRAFESTEICAFVPLGIERDSYFDHGDFVLPFSAGTGGEDVDFVTLGHGLRKMREHLHRLGPQSMS